MIPMKQGREEEVLEGMPVRSRVGGHVKGVSQHLKSLLNLRHAHLHVFLLWNKVSDNEEMHQQNTIACVCGMT